MKPDHAGEAQRLTGHDLRRRYTQFVDEERLAEGIAEFEAQLARNPRWGLAWDLLGRLKEKAGDDEGAYAAFREGLEIALHSRRMSRQLKADLVVRVIEFCHARGWSERAAAHTDTIARLAPRHPLLERLRGASPSDAMPALTRHLDRRGEAQALVHRARDRFRQRDWTAARDLYRQAIDIDERCTNGYIFLARTLKNMDPEALAEGIEWYAHWVEQRPSWGLGHNLLAQLYVAADRADEAYAAFDRAAALSDSSPTLDLGRKCELRADLIDFCTHRGWRERADIQRQRLADLDPHHPMLSSEEQNVELSAARAAVRADRPGEAIARYSRHVLRDPHDRDAHVELAALYRGADRATRAAGIRLFERVVARSPRWGLGHRLLGELREAQGDDEGAYAALVEATSLGMASKRLDDATRIRNLLELVDFCNRRGWSERALIHVAAALSLDPNHGEALALWNLLERRVG